jgi:hydroxyacylglutathione hydrolase
MSYVVKDTSGTPWMVFTGDTLFAGDVGRVDLVDNIPPQEMAHRLYDSLFNKLLPLGSEVIVLPAHGAGSACGTQIADRLWTTLGLEQKLNPKLQYQSENQFVEAVANTLERPPYFRTIEQLNLKGAPLLTTIQPPQPLSAEAFERAAARALIVDTRMELGFSAAHITNALSLWQTGLPSFAGWFLSCDQPILLVNETDDATDATNILRRLGYDRIIGFLAGGMLSWHMAGKPSRSIQTVTVSQLCHELDQKKEPWILDVRSSEEIREHGAIPGAHHIHVTQVSLHSEHIPHDRDVYIFCGSGMRSMTAASFLQHQGWQNLTVVLGGLAGWHSTSCPLE